MVTYVVAIILIAFIFDFSNGFHDSANSIATIVGTRVLSPFAAVVWAAVFNFSAIFVSSGAVAKAVSTGFIDTSIVDPNVMCAAVLGAVVWNIITWYYGIPCSSSHTLIGSLLGGGFALWTMHHGNGPNWTKAQEIGLDWWKYDHHLAPGRNEAELEKEALRQQVRLLERKLENLTRSTPARRHASRGR